jgi:RNase P/RNase MRP subunit POP5
MKALKPSMREKKRYLKIKGAVSEAEKAILEGIGTIGASKTSFNWIKKGKDSGVISVNRGSLDHVKACFSLWPKKIIVERVSGTLKGLKEKGGKKGKKK